MNYCQIEQKVRKLFNKQWQGNAEKCRLPIGATTHKHEFDLYERGKVIGGISTSPWKNKTEKKTNNTGGQDRVASELLWLSLWTGKEKRLHILTDHEMAQNTFNRYKYGNFSVNIDIYHCDYKKRIFTKIGTLKKSNNMAQQGRDKKRRAC